MYDLNILKVVESKVVLRTVIIIVGQPDERPLYKKFFATVNGQGRFSRQFITTGSPVRSEKYEVRQSVHHLVWAESLLNFFAEAKKKIK